MAVEVQIRGAYGDSELIQAVADARGVLPTWLLPVPGTSTANWAALAAVSKPGDTVLAENPVWDPLGRAAQFLGWGV